MSDEKEITIIDVLEHYDAQIPDNLKRYGWNKMHCPFHGDEHKSAAVSLEYDAFNCLGCRIGGRPLKVIALWENFGDEENIDWRAADEFAKRILGGSVKRIRKSTNRSKERRKRESTWRSAILD